MMNYWKKTILDKVSADIKKEFGSEPVYNKKLMKTNIKSYGDEATDFYNKEIPKAGSDCTSLAVVTTDSALEKDKNYYPQVFLKECKYMEEEVIRHINGDPENSSDKSIKE